ncbi:AzlD domain-containing protein [Diaphorobacter ruginosibacter]|uniref:AzlD domain-containing protein n=1 Tax=Diaphorobacter ruginosibacter TaxID=1715720 RepID=A0A7G9RKB4_9BURK|nr:AzlD domain-containing protein [Diaphorobacter ruginosibacter]QNN56039.1 AzlD domain-containing protein [Diaphorobacter ruginosibacter]
MSTSGYVALLVSALVTLLLRVLPILLMSRMRLGATARSWLGFIPASIMAAMVAAELILKPEWSSSGLSISALAAAVATVCGLISRSLFVTVLAGVAAFMGLQFWLG